MEPHVYKRLVEMEQTGWYYVARRNAIRDLIVRFIAPGSKRLKILDIGCGTGGNTNFLATFGDVTGLEPSSLAIKLLIERYPNLKIVKGGAEDIPMKFQRQTFDLCTILGVLCQKGVSNPERVLQDVCAMLKGGGWLIWSEGVYPFLTRQLDEETHGARRFYPRQMCSFLTENGFKIQFKTHLVSWGFPISLALAFLYRFKKDSSAHKKNEADEAPEMKIQNRYINNLLYAITRLEWKLSMDVFPPPFGVSYLILAQKCLK